MNIEGTTSITILTTILSEVSDTKKPVSDTITQQLFYTDQALMTEILRLKLDRDSGESLIYLDEMAKRLASMKLEINKLKPHIEESGQEKRLKAINDINAMIDRSQLRITKDIKLR